MLVLGIETTCDETAAAVIERAPDGSGKILSNIVRSQVEEHARFGGVVPELGQSVRLVTIADVAIGEALDKVAKMLGLPYPGGPQVERAAARGDPAPFAFPRPMQGRPDANFSLSELKTAVRNEASRLAE